MNQKLLAVAAGQAAADIVVKNGKIVNVYSGEIYDGGVAICGDTIAAVGEVDYTIGEDTRIIDAGGKYLTPGFIDGHIHPESSSLSIRSFAEIVLQHGTTVIMSDLHEIGVVGGLEAIEAVLEENEITDLKIYFISPNIPVPAHLRLRRTRQFLPDSPAAFHETAPRCPPAFLQGAAGSYQAARCRRQEKCSPPGRTPPCAARLRSRQAPPAPGRSCAGPCRKAA